MTLQSSGAITIDDIRTEFTGTGNLSDYYRGGGLVPSDSDTDYSATKNTADTDTDFAGVTGLSVIRSTETIGAVSNTGTASTTGTAGLDVDVTEVTVNSTAVSLSNNTISIAANTYVDFTVSLNSTNQNVNYFSGQGGGFCYFTGDHSTSQFQLTGASGLSFSATHSLTNVFGTVSQTNYIDGSVVSGNTSGTIDSSWSAGTRATGQSGNFNEGDNPCSVEFTASRARTNLSVRISGFSSSARTLTFTTTGSNDDTLALTTANHNTSIKTYTVEYTNDNPYDVTLTSSSTGGSGTITKNGGTRTISNLLSNSWTVASSNINDTGTADKYAGGFGVTLSGGDISNASSISVAGGQATPAITNNELNAALRVTIPANSTFSLTIPVTMQGRIAYSSYDADFNNGQGGFQVQNQTYRVNYGNGFSSYGPAVGFGGGTLRLAAYYDVTSGSISNLSFQGNSINQQQVDNLEVPNNINNSTPSFVASRFVECVVPNAPTDFGSNGVIEGTAGTTRNMVITGTSGSTDAVLRFTLISGGANAGNYQNSPTSTTGWTITSTVPAHDITFVNNNNASISIANDSTGGARTFSSGQSIKVQDDKVDTDWTIALGSATGYTYSVKNETGTDGSVNGIDVVDESTEDIYEYVSNASQVIKWETTKAINEDVPTADAIKLSDFYGARVD